MHMEPEGWIERSLQRLEWLEADRERLVAEGPSAAAKLAEYDTETATLYEALELAADDAEEEPAAPVACVDADDTLIFIEHVGWTTFRDLEPLPAAVAPSPEPDFVVDDAWSGGSTGWRWILPAAAALLVCVGLGTWLALRPGEAVASTSVEQVATTPEAIEAAAIPEDTQEPDAARGVDAERTPSTGLDAAIEASTSAPRSQRAHHPRRARSNASGSHAIDLGKSREPLAGL
jgi:hypothetical protein